jgi:hypothetical protein
MRTLIFRPRREDVAAKLIIRDGLALSPKEISSEESLRMGIQRWMKSGSPS